jgi:hypothetical protein
LKIAHIVGAATLAGALALGACVAEPGGNGGYDETSSGYTTEDCDAEDLANFEDDCGYWGADGVFVYWYWVGSYGGYRPAGFSPYYPPGSHKTRPPNAKTSAKPTTQSRPKGAPTATRSIPTATVPKYTPPPAKPKVPTAKAPAPAPKPPAYKPPAAPKPRR